MKFLKYYEICILKSHGETNDSAQLTKSQILHGTSRQVAHNSKKLIEAFDPPDVVNMNFNYFLDQISPSASHGNLANGVVASSTNSNFVFPSVPLAFNPEVHAIEKNEDEDTSLKSKLCCDFRKVQVTGEYITHTQLLFLKQNYFI